MEHRLLQHRDVAWPRRRRGRRRGKIAERRHADKLAAEKPIPGRGALAVDADLSRAQQLFQASVAEARKMPLEPAIDADLGILGGDGDGLNATHAGVFQVERAGILAGQGR